MKYEIVRNGTKHHVEFARENGTLVAEIEGNSHSAEFRSPQPGLFVFRFESRVFQVFAFPRYDGKLEVFLDGTTHLVHIPDRRRREGKGSSEEGPLVVASPMPGRVVRVLAQVGDQVEAGQGVVVVEAMKMQNEMSASKPGKVVEIKVVEGQTVKAGEVLAVVE